MCIVAYKFPAYFRCIFYYIMLTKDLQFVRSQDEKMNSAITNW